MAKASIATVRQYVQLAKRRDKLDADLKATKQKMKDLEEKILDYFAANGIQNLRSGERLVGLRREIWGSLRDKAEGVRLLREHGFGDLVVEGPNHQQFSAWVRELLDKAEQQVVADGGEVPVDNADLSDRLPLPADLKAVISVTEKWSLRVTK